MNHDPNNPNLSTLIDPELEARVVAWVTGEASPFEAAELTRLTTEKPELAIFHRRIAAVSGLVGEAIRADKEPLRLAPERRAKLLQALGAPEFKPNSSSDKSTVVLPLAAAKKKQRINRRWIYGLAACLAVGLFTVISVPSFKASREMNYKRLALPLASSEPRDTKIVVALPVPENFEKSARSDGEKRHVMAVKQQSARPAALAKSRVALPLPPLGGTTIDAGSVSSDYAASPANAPSPSFGFAGPVAGGKMVAENKEESIVLSPFIVESTKNEGYAAKSALAGSRLNTAEKDVASAITVVTPEFLRDTGATTVNEVLSYISNTEAGGLLTKAADKKGDAGDDDLPLDQTKAKLPAPAPTLTEINATKEPVSTFSLHVSDVSFRLAQAALDKGEEPDEDTIRPEEFYNAFSYGDPTPALAEKVTCRIEQAAHPFAQQRNLVRIAVKVAAAGRDAAQPLHLTVLLDTSGSMEREDRAATIRSAMSSLISLLGANDRLTLIGFSRQPRLLAESIPGDQAAQVLDLIAHTPTEGGTNLEEALKLGSELAHRQLDAAAQNRIVLLTDGAANLGNANPAQLAATIEQLRQQKIAFDACGVGLEGLDDGMLENLTRKGDGRYYVLNSPEAADAGFAKQLAGAFRPAAENVKLQVRFNPSRVGNYRLIGFEQHRLNEEDFRNDKVDAAELAAEEAAVAVYQVEALPQGEGELGEVYVRFRDATSGQMVERNWTLNYDAQAPAFDRATPSMQLAGVAALLAEKLQGGEAGNTIALKELASVVAKLRSHYAHEPRVQELVTMFEQARKLSGE